MMLSRFLVLTAVVATPAAAQTRASPPKPSARPPVKAATPSKGPAPAKAPPRRTLAEVVGVLLYDGKLAEQVELEKTTRAAFQAFAPRVELRTLHAGTADAVPFLKRFQLTRKDAPLFLELDEPGPRARIKRRVPLRPDDDPHRSLRIMLATLKLPAPKVKVPEPGVLVGLPTDGSEAEKALLITAAGPQRVEGGARVLEIAAYVSYRLRIPEALRHADLRAEAGGPFALDYAEEPQGPWRPLMNTRTYFSGAEVRLRERLKPVVDLDAILDQLPGNLYVRFRGLGRTPVTLARLELVARAAGQASGEGAWLTEVEAIRERLHVALSPEASRGTLIGGRVEKDRLLKAAESPFLLTGDLVVPFGRKLTVEAGVIVKAAGRFVIRVQGDLIARGTPAQPIVFQPAVASQPDDWSGIEFIAARGYYAGAASGLSHCRFANAALALDLRRFAGTVDGCEFVNCLQGVRLAEGGKGKLARNRFTRCLRGLLVDGGAGEVTENAWTDCLVALAVNDLHPQMPFRFERNSVVGSRQAAVFYPCSPTRKPPPLALGNNHWAGTPDGRMLGGGATSDDVVLEPRLPEAPAGAGIP